MVRARKGSTQTAEQLDPKDKKKGPDRFLADGFPNPEAMDVWEYMQTLTELQWEKHITYLYRINPTISRIPGQNAYLDKYAGPVSIDFIREKFGGKEFRLDLNRLDTHKTAYRVRFPIEATPKLQTGETAETGGAAAAGGDSSSLTVLSDVIRDLMVQNAEAQRDGKPFDSSAAIAEALKIQSAGATSAIEMIAAQAKGTGSGGDASLMKMILPLLLDRAFAKPQADTSPVEQIKAVLELTNDLRSQGGGGGGTENPWAALATAIGPKLDTVLERVANIVQNWAVIAVNKNPAAAAQLRQANAATAAPGAAPAAASPAAAAPTQEQIEQFEHAVIIKRLKGMIVQMLLAGESGMAAAEISEKMDPAWTDEFTKILQDNIASLASDPIFAPAMSAPRLAEFTAEFLEYFEPEEPQAAPAAAEPAEAVPAA